MDPKHILLRKDVDKERSEINALGEDASIWGLTHGKCDCEINLKGGKLFLFFIVLMMWIFHTH